MSAYHFNEPPSVGTRIKVGRTFVTVKGSEPYVRKDGQPTRLIHWVSDDGRTGKSGLTFNSISWDKADQ